LSRPLRQFGRRLAILLFPRGAQSGTGQSQERAFSTSDDDNGRLDGARGACWLVCGQGQVDAGPCAGIRPCRIVGRGANSGGAAATPPGAGAAVDPPRFAHRRNNVRSACSRRVGSMGAMNILFNAFTTCRLRTGVGSYAKNLLAELTLLPGARVQPFPAGWLAAA